MPRNLNGYKRNLKDDRDYLFKENFPTLAVLPQEVYLVCPPVKDQGDLGSCVFNGLTTQMEMVEINDKIQTRINFSRLELYYKYRQIDGDVSQDTGAYPRVVASVAQKYGACNEALWPYDVSKFAVKPPDACFTEAMDHQVLKYYACQSQADIMQAIAQGRSVGFGFTVYSSFMSDAMAASGIWAGRQSGDQVEGGHYVVAIGYDQNKVIGSDKGAALMINSWGTDWGCKPSAYSTRGFFWMSFNWLLKVGSDFQVVQTIEEPVAPAPPSPTPTPTPVVPNASFTFGVVDNKIQVVK